MVSPQDQNLLQTKSTKYLNNFIFFRSLRQIAELKSLVEQLTQEKTYLQDRCRFQTDEISKLTSKNEALEYQIVQQNTII